MVFKKYKLILFKFYLKIIFLILKLYYNIFKKIITNFD